MNLTKKDFCQESLSDGAKVLRSPFYRLYHLPTVTHQISGPNIARHSRKFWELSYCGGKLLGDCVTGQLYRNGVCLSNKRIRLTEI